MVKHSYLCAIYILYRYQEYTRFSAVSVDGRNTQINFNVLITDPTLKQLEDLAEHYKCVRIEVSIDGDREEVARLVSARD